MKRRCNWSTPLLLFMMSAAGVALCLSKGMDAVAFGWTAAAICSLAWLASELDPREKKFCFRYLEIEIID